MQSKKENNQIQERLIRLEEVLSIIPVGKSTWYAGINKGVFPKPVKIFNRSLWRMSEIMEIVENGIKEKPSG